ncbi:MAG: YggU family protein [Candidatus Altiarchaeales archaeon ex4484_96]|nr:MAG: YggU family protein [Candidatus Altiarchaeales archaeon ex4484_96]
MRQTKEGVLLDVKVVPNSAKESLSYDPVSEVLKVKVIPPAAKNKANKRVVELINKSLGECEIVSGAKNRKKILLVKGLNQKNFLEKILLFI